MITEGVPSLDVVCWTLDVRRSHRLLDHINGIDIKASPNSDILRIFESFRAVTGRCPGQGCERPVMVPDPAFPGWDTTVKGRIRLLVSFPRMRESRRGALSGLDACLRRHDTPWAMHSFLVPLLKLCPSLSAGMARCGGCALLSWDYRFVSRHVKQASSQFSV